MIGPRFLPLSHGSWDDEYLTLTSSARGIATENSRQILQHIENTLIPLSALISSPFAPRILVLLKSRWHWAPARRARTLTSMMHSMLLTSSSCSSIGGEVVLSVIHTSSRR